MASPILTWSFSHQDDLAEKCHIISENAVGISVAVQWSRFGRKYTINNSHSSENDFGLQQVRPIDVVTPVNRSIPQCGTPIVISFSIFLYSSFRVLSLPQ